MFSSNNASEKYILIKSVAQVANRYFYVKENAVSSLKLSQGARRNCGKANGNSVSDPIEFFFNAHSQVVRACRLTVLMLIIIQINEILLLSSLNRQNNMSSIGKIFCHRALTVPRFQATSYFYFADYTARTTVASYNSQFVLIVSLKRDERYKTCCTKY